jgi:hypothetical protein
MAISRTSLVRGPSKNTFNGGSCFSKEDFEIKVNKETLVLNTSAHGRVDERVIEVQEEASITPDGRWTTAILDAFINPFANMVVGQSLLTSTDKPFVASGSDGAVHTMIAACVTKLPDIYLSAKKTMFGSMTIKGFRQLAKGWTDASSIHTIGTGGSLTDSTWNPLNIVVQPYSATWGSVAGFSGFDTQDGWTISFNLSTEEIEVDSTGKIDIAFKSLEVMAKCTPVGPSSAQILAAANVQGLSGANGMVRGYSLQNDGSGGVTPDLVITGSDGSSLVTIKAAGLKSYGYQFGATKLRVGEVGFVASRLFPSGAQAALFTLAAAS